MLADPALSLALRTWVGDDHPLAAALPAGGRDRKKSLLSADLAGAAAVGALPRAAGAAARASAVARLALSEALKLDDLFDSGGGFLEFNFQIVAKIVAAPGARTRTSPSGAEKIAKNVGEDFLETLAEVEATESAGALRSLERGMAEAIVLGAALAFGEDLVGLVEFLESLLGFFVAGVAIGMKLNREAPVRLLQFIFTGAAIDAENFIVIALVGRRHRAKILCHQTLRRHCREKTRRGRRCRP